MQELNLAGDVFTTKKACAKKTSDSTSSTESALAMSECKRGGTMQVKCYTLTMEKDGSISANAVSDISTLSRADVYVGTAAGAKLARCGVGRLEELEGRGVFSRIRVLAWVHTERSSRRSACKMMSLADVDAVCAEFGMDVRSFTVLPAVTVVINSFMASLVCTDERYTDVFDKFIKVAISSGKSLQAFCDYLDIDADTIRRFYTGGKIHAMREDTAQKMAQITNTPLSAWPPATAACRRTVEKFTELTTPSPPPPPTCRGCAHDRRGLVCGKDERLNFNYKWCAGYENKQFEPAGRKL